MKKLISIFLTAVLMLCAPCLGAMAEADEVSGAWYLNAIESGGVSMNPASIGLEMTLTLHADGSAVVSMTSEEDGAGSWVREGDKITAQIDGEPMEFTLAGNMLIAGDEDGDTKMTFGREKEIAEAFQPAPAMANPELADFDGTWIATMIDAMGVQLPIAVTGMEMTLIIEGGVVSVTQTAGGDEVLTGAEGTLQGGALTVSSDPLTDGEALSFALTLHEDGTMSYAGDDTGTIYFERQITE